MQLGAGLSAQPFNNKQDFDNFLERGEGFVVWMEQAIVNMREGSKKGIIHAKPIVESMLPQFKAQVLENPEDSMLLQPLNNAGDKLSDKEKAILKKKYLDFIENRLSPVFAKAAAFIEKEYLPKGSERTRPGNPTRWKSLV